MNHTQHTKKAYTAPACVQLELLTERTADFIINPSKTDNNQWTREKEEHKNGFSKEMWSDIEE